MKTALLASFAGVVGLAMASHAQAAMIDWFIPVTVNQEVTAPTIPSGLPTDVPAGVATITYDTSTNMFSWDFWYAGLTANATQAHVHGPAPAGANAGILINVIGSNGGAYGVGADPLSLPGLHGHVTGSVDLNDVAAFKSTTVGALQSDLLNGLWYVNLHTSTNPGGEIRGQIPYVPEPASLGLLALGGLALLRRRR